MVWRKSSWYVLISVCLSCKVHTHKDSARSVCVVTRNVCIVRQETCRSAVINTHIKTFSVCSTSKVSSGLLQIVSYFGVLAISYGYGDENCTHHHGQINHLFSPPSVHSLKVFHTRTLPLPGLLCGNLII